MRKILLLVGLVSLLFMGCPNELELVAINVKANKVSYTVGESVAPSDIEVVATYRDGTSKAVSVFTVTPATFSEAGTITVTVAYSENGVTAMDTYTVSVTAKTYTVIFNPSDLSATGTMEPQTFGDGVAQPLTACGFTLSGYTFIGWATSAGGAKVYDDAESITLTADVELYALWEMISVSGISLNKNQVWGDHNETIQLTATITPSDAYNKNITWSTDDPNIAEVDANGLVTIKSSVVWESATITAQTEDGNQTASCTVTVIKKPTATEVTGTDFVEISVASIPLGSDGSYKVTLTKAFKICKHEVTQKEWVALMGSNPSTYTTKPADEEIQENRPVENINWYSAIAYCNKLTETNAIKRGASNDIDYVYFSDDAYTNAYTATDASNKNPAYIRLDANNKIDATGYRLPTEAEWDIAARGGLAGNVYASVLEMNFLDTCAWYYGNAGDKTHEVMKKTPNNYGLYDMLGNVWEWCNDGWTTSFPKTEAEDPLVLQVGSPIIRGCSCAGTTETELSYLNGVRTYRDVGYKNRYIGFRVVRF